MLLSLLELAGNRVLESDPETQQKLQKLQGKTLALAIKNPPMTLLLTPTQVGIDLALAQENSSITPDVTLTTTVSALVKISRNGLEEAELAPGELDIAGDAIIGQRFANIIANLNIDWEELLAEQIGDSPARLASVGMNKASEKLQQTHSELKHLINDFLQDDLALTALPKEVQSFIDDVDILRGDTDRLMARITTIRQNYTDHTLNSK